MKKFYKKRQFDDYPLLFTYIGNIRNSHYLIGIEENSHRIRTSIRTMYKTPARKCCKEQFPIGE